MPLHGLKFDNPLFDGSQDVIIQSLVAIQRFIDHILDELVVDLECFGYLF